MTTRQRPVIAFGLGVLLSIPTVSFASPAQDRVARPPRPAPPSGKYLASLPSLNPPPAAGPSTLSAHRLRENEKMVGYLAWLDRIERERAVLRDLGMTATNFAQAFERIRAFERCTLGDRPPRPESLFAGDRFYLAAVTLEAKHTVEIIRALREGKSDRAQVLAREGSREIDRQLEKARRELSWYYRQRKLGSPPAIVPSSSGSYFGYLAGHAPR